VRVAERWRLAVERVRENRQLGVELGWVAFAKAGEFVATFVLLKILTTRLGAHGYGEYNLAEVALVLLHGLALVPVHESFLRAYHGASEDGTLRAAFRTLVVSYAISGAGVAIVAFAASSLLAGHFELHAWTICAAGLVFLFDRWRFLGVEYRRIRRERRSAAFHAVGFQIGLVTTLWIVTAIRPSAAAALLAFAAVAAAAAALGLPKLLRDYSSLPHATRDPVRPLLVPFGVPFAAMWVLLWFQSFSDRYLIQSMLDMASAGIYVAAYQVSGIPFTLMNRFFHESVVPIAYQRAGDGSDAKRLWAADRVLLVSLGIQLASGAVLLVLLVVLAPRLLVLLTSQEFLLPTSTLAALAAGRFAQNLGFAAQPFFSLHGRNTVLLAYRLLGGALSVWFCIVGIQRSGTAGAAIGGALATSLYLLLTLMGPAGVFRLARGARLAARA
jgi:O-antigen/teichoic acid export membrane protein